MCHQFHNIFYNILNNFLYHHNDFHKYSPYLNRHQSVLGLFLHIICIITQLFLRYLIILRKSRIRNRFLRLLGHIKLIIRSFKWLFFLDRIFSTFQRNNIVIQHFYCQFLILIHIFLKLIFLYIILLRIYLFNIFFYI